MAAFAYATGPDHAIALADDGANASGRHAPRTKTRGATASAIRATMVDTPRRRLAFAADLAIAIANDPTRTRHVAPICRVAPAAQPIGRTAATLHLPGEKFVWQIRHIHQKLGGDRTAPCRCGLLTLLTLLTHPPELMCYMRCCAAAPHSRRNR